MFTIADKEFLHRLDAKAEASLCGADSVQQRLRSAMAVLRSVLDIDTSAVPPSALVEVDALLDGVWVAVSRGDGDLARSLAARLAHAVLALDVTGPRRMRAMDAALELRSLVVVDA
jgi:hypothetical protein